MTQFTERAQDIASSPLDANQKLIANLALSLDEHIANLAEDDPSKVVAALRELGMTRLANLLDAKRKGPSRSPSLAPRGCDVRRYLAIEQATTAEK